MRATRSATWIREGQGIITADGAHYRATADSDDANLLVEVKSESNPARTVLAYDEIRAIVTVHGPTGRTMTIPVNDHLH